MLKGRERCMWKGPKWEFLFTAKKRFCFFLYYIALDSINQIYFGHFDAPKVWMFQGDLLGIDYSWILVLLSFPIPVIVSEKGINYPKRGCPGYLEWLLNVKVALASQNNAQLFILLEQLAYIRCLLSTDSGYPCTITNPRSGQVFDRDRSPHDRRRLIPFPGTSISHPSVPPFASDRSSASLSLSPWLLVV